MMLTDNQRSTLRALNLSASAALRMDSVHREEIAMKQAFIYNAREVINQMIHGNFDLVLAKKFMRETEK